VRAGLVCYARQTLAKVEIRLGRQRGTPMRTQLLARATTLMVAGALTVGGAVATTTPVSAAPTPVAAQSVPGDPALPAYPGLPPQTSQRSALAAVATTSVPCDDNGADKTLTRDEVLTRARSWLSVGIPYSQLRCYRNQYGDYRTDCSGFVSMAWGLGGAGSAFWTGNLLDRSHTIARSDLQPGDALLRHTGDPSENHVALFVKWADSAHTQPNVMEQTGSRDTVQDTWSASYASLYTPVRYDHIRENILPDRPGVYRPSTRTWYRYGSETFGPYGEAGDVPVVGDWNGDGVDEIGVYRPSTRTWYRYGSETFGPYGEAGDVPVVGDWNGDGRDEIGMYRPSTRTWYRYGSETFGPYGEAGDVPVVGDWNGDGSDEIGMYRPSTRTWYRYGSETFGPYGEVGDIPVTGRWP
jgi:hypothetical protein